MDRKPVVISIAWYRPEDWEELLRISVDSDQLEATHAEWLKAATKAREDFLARGAFVHKVIVDLKELQEWCARRRVPIDAGARAEFACERIQKTARHAGPDRPRK